ncbi:MAG: hypothetical protein QG587_1016, partial [Chloroflexota bacterium]|nr:hypothetical protein [Chloroflexota bacterium]
MPQWYIQTPANSALYSKSYSSPGLIEVISSFQATSELWTSTECVSWLVAGF